MSMKANRIILSIVFVVCWAAACAKPLNQATSDRYGEACSEAERHNRLAVAEQACYRALVNVDWGHLGDFQKSQRLYNLARIKRKLNKFEEAEKLYKDSLAIEEKLPKQSNENLGRRLAELAILYEQCGRIADGFPYVHRLYALAEIYQGGEKKTVAAVFYIYSLDLKKQQKTAEAEKLASKAFDMGFDPKDLELD
jgi:tetratricopeptide (TPR) repeat protein